MEKYIMALDQGTTSSRCILFDKEGNIKSVAQKEFSQIYPRAGWVEHDPMEIWSTQISVATEAMAQISAVSSDIAGIGITNQRETTIVWDKRTGQPVYNAIVWQCRRTSDMINDLKIKGYANIIKSKTGLIPDAYFSATKLKWILDNVEGAREDAEAGNLLFGTVDTWLIWNLTKASVFVTDYTNASRTMLFNIKSLEWDKELLKEFNIPICMMPEVKPSSYIYGYTAKEFFEKPIPIAAAAGDQQAALFGQCCFNKGDVKNTYGTGCFLLMNTGEKIIESSHGLITTIAASISSDVEYALEGSVFVGGAAVQWLRDELRIIRSSEESEKAALEVDDTNGMYVVPAFTGLGAPHWDQYARGTIIGITRGCNREHLIRATLESIAYQTHDVIRAMEKDSEISLKHLKVDGGASANKFLMQFQADILNTPVYKPRITELTALGAAYLAGLAVGIWKSTEELKSNWEIEHIYKSNMVDNKREENLKGWNRAIKHSLSWEEN